MEENKENLEEQPKNETTKKTMKRVTISDWLMTLILVVLVFLMELTLLFFNRLFTLHAFGLIIDILFYGGLFFLVNLIPHKLTKKIIFTVLLTFLSFIFIIDAIYSYFFTSFGSVSSLKGVGTLAGGGDLGVKYTLSAIILTIMFALGVTFIWFFKLETKTKRRTLLATLIATFTIISGLTISNSVTLSVIKNATYDTRLEYYGSNTFLYDYFLNSYDFVRNFGYVNFRLRDVFYKPENTIEDEVETFFAKTPSEHTNDFTALFEDYNVITMMCETLDTRILSETLTPNMIDVMKKSILFENWYTPTFFEGATINSEYMTNTGLIPTAPKAWGSNIAHTYKDNDWSMISLPGQLREQGYDTFYLHLNNKSFYMRDRFIPGLGFEYSYFTEDIPFDTHHFDMHLSYLLEEYVLKPYEANPNKFYINMLNYSMHSGHDGDYTTSDPNNPNYESYQMVKETYPHLPHSTQTYYTKATMFDKYIKNVFTALENSSAKDNTIVLMFPDHYNYGDNGSLYSESELNIDEHDKEKEIHHQTMTMYLPESAKAKLLDTVLQKYQKENSLGGTSLDTLAATIDITPTILNLVSKKGNFKYFMGNDIFEDKPKYVYFSDQTVFDGTAFYGVKNGLYPLSRLELDNEEVELHREFLRTKLEHSIDCTIISGIILSLDYFASLKEKEPI